MWIIGNGYGSEEGYSWCKKFEFKVDNREINVGMVYNVEFLEDLGGFALY